MADLSQVELNGTTYDLKDLTIRRAHGLDPIATKTYTNVIATANDNNGAGFFYLKVRADAYTTAWHVKTRVKATVPGNVNYNTDTIFDIWGHTNTYSWYACLNRIRSTSYRPIYYNSLFRLNETGYNNGCANWVGFSLVGATNNTSSSYKRQVIVELLEYDGCTVELQDSLITPTNIPERAAHTNWYTSTNTSFDNFDACSYGLKQSGDANTTDISNLTFGNGTYIADSAVYCYQLLFQKDENTLTPLNNNDNTTGTTKTMLTNVEFNPFGRIAYYNSTTNISAGGSLGAGALFWQRSGFDLRYTFNCGTTLTAQKPFYLVVTPTSNGLCKIASTTPWSQTLPTSNDGKWYILLGRTYSTYQMALYAYHPVYYHDGLKVKMLVEPEPSTNSVMTLDASGNIVTFNHASTDVPLKSLAVDIEPQQNLHGYDAPWAGGSGKNKLPMVLANMKTNNSAGTWSGNAYTLYGVTYTVNVDDGGNVVSISATGTATQYSLFYLCDDVTYSSKVILSGCPTSSYSSYRIQAETIRSETFQDAGSSVQIPANSAITRVIIAVPSGVNPSGAIFKPMIRLDTVSDATFAPYTNECLINGWNGLSSTRDRKNLLDATQNEEGGIDASGVEVDGNTFRRSSNYIPIKANTSYVLWANNNWTVRLYWYDSNKTFISPRINGNTGGKAIGTSPSNAAYARWSVYNANAPMTYEEVATSQLQLEAGSTATAYVPYVNERSGYVNITGKNIFDASSYPFIANRFINLNDGTINISSANAYAATDDYVPVSHLAGKTITLNLLPPGNAPGMAFYDSTKIYISGAKGTAVTVPSNAVYMRFTVPYANADGNGIQIELGSTASTYEPYIIGENLLDQVEWTVGPITSNGSISTDTNFQHSPVMSVKPGETYILTYGIGRTGNRRIHGYVNGTWSQQITYKDYSATGGRDSLTFTIPSGINGLAVSLSNLDSYVRLELVDPVSVTWSDVGGTGKNLFDPTANPNKWINASGQLTTVSGAKVSQKISCAQGDTFTVSTESGISTLAICFYASDDSVTQRTAQQDSASITATAPANTAYVRSATYGESGKEVQLEKGSTATTYAPYYVGTVYGAKVDLVSGKMTVDWKTVTIDGTGGNDTSINNNIRVRYPIPNDSVVWNDTSTKSGYVICDMFPEGTNSESGTGTVCFHLRANGSHEVVFGFGSSFPGASTFAEATTWITANKPVVCYKLAKPIVYQLTPQQIHALKGTNVIYTNCGPVKVEYYTESMIQATDSYAGLMSAVDKRKLDALSGIAISETEPTNDSILAWIDPDASDTIGILSETEINSQYVSHEHAQTLTSAQQNRALQNIGISDGTDAQKTNLATFAGISLTVVGTI